MDNLTARYINSIHNNTKRAYAFEYYLYLRRVSTGEPARPGELSVMAAQAVRLALTKFLTG